MFFKTGWPYFIVLLPPDKDKKAQTVHNETFKFRLRQGLKKIKFSTLGTIGIIFFHCFSPHFLLFQFISLSPSLSITLRSLMPSFHCMVQNIWHTIPLWFTHTRTHPPTPTHPLSRAYCFVHYILLSLCHGAFSFLIHKEWKRRSCGENQQKTKSQHWQQC